MNLNNFLKIIELEIKNNGSQVKTAKKIGKEKSSFNANLKNLREGKGITYSTLREIMHGLGYDIYVKKRK